MPKQRKPDLLSGSEILRKVVQKSISENQGRGGKGRKKKFRNDSERIVSDVQEKGNVTKRPMLPEEYPGYTPEGDTSSEPGGLETTKSVRERVFRLTQRVKFPSWMLDVKNSRYLNGVSSDETPEDADLRRREERTNNQEIKSLFSQTNPIKTDTHPESCICGKGGVCATKQTESGETSRLPLGISKEEEDEWLSNEAAKREISKDQMREWYDEQRSPSSIRIPGTSHPAGREPEGHHPLLAQLDHDPREECGAHGRNPIGHIVYVHNHDGAIPNFPRGLNLCMVVGTSPRGSEGRRSLSPEIVAEHRAICGEGTDHKEGCPIKFHDDNCRGGSHSPNCEIPKNTVLDGAHEGEPLYKVIPFSAVPQAEIQKRFKSQVNFNGLGAPAPEWKPTGITGLQGGVDVSPSRCIHVPSEAIPEFLKRGNVEGKADAQEYFGTMDGIVGTRHALLTHPIYYPNPFSEVANRKNRTLPGYAYIMDQLESPSVSGEGPQGVDKGFAPGAKPSAEKPEEDILNNIMNRIPKKPKESSIRSSYTHVNENYKQTPSCRFCEDASYKDGKGPIVQTGIAPDGRPLYAHEECDNPFSFTETFKFDFGGPNPVDDDFITLGSHNWGMQYQQDARKINRELGIVTPSKAESPVDPGFAQPGNKKKIDSMGLPEHNAAESIPKEDPAMETEVNNLNGNGTAKPPK